MVTDPTITTVTIGDIDYYLLSDPFFLIEFTSQATGKVKRFNSNSTPSLGNSVTGNYFNRWFSLVWFYDMSYTLGEDLSNGKIYIGKPNCS